MTDAYYLGQLVRTSTTANPFKNTAGAPADPTTVKLVVRRPNGAETTYTYGVDALVVRNGAGDYRADLDGNQVGQWLCAWRGSGAVQATIEDDFFIHSGFRA
jgi:hypothetical protein